MIMATDNILCFEDQVLSDVHVNLSHSDKIDKINDCPKRQQWLSLFHFWLPHVTDKKTMSFGDIYTSAEKINTCDNDHHVTYVSHERQTHNSIEKQTHHNSIEKQSEKSIEEQTNKPIEKQTDKSIDKQTHHISIEQQTRNSIEQQTHNSIEQQTHNSMEQQTHNSMEQQTRNSMEKQILELDEDGDILLVRRETHGSGQDSHAAQDHCSRARNTSHTVESDTNTLLLPCTKRGYSSPKDYNPRSSSDVFIEPQQCSSLFMDTSCRNAADSELDVGSYSDLDTKVVSSCEQKATIPCQINREIFSEIISSSHQIHRPSSLSEDKLGNDTDMSHDHGTISQTNLISPREELDVGVLTLEHSLQTTLPEVGFQVWSGALLLCDYLIHNRRHLENSIVLDLGAGTGISSIIAAMFASCVICTDYLSGIVALCERNWQRNKYLLPRRTCDQVCFKILDWMCDWESQDAASKSHYDIMPADLKLIEDATIILAAEVIYDEELTDAFFRTIYKLLMKSPPKTVLLTLERRIVFSAHNQDICSPAYEHFLENLEDLVTVDEGPVYFTVERLSSAFPQHFQYQRVKELELWQISSHLHE